MGNAMKYLIPGIAAAAGVLLGGQLWNYVAIRAIGPEWQLALVTAICAMAGGLIGEKLGLGGGGGKK